MYSSRHFNVQRHIDKIHSGIGRVISYVEFVSGVEVSHFKRPQPTYRNARTPSKIFAEEYYRELARQAVNSITFNQRKVQLGAILASLD
jgi:hypothetical protein